MTLKIGFIGLGHMGYPMAFNLLKSDIVHTLYIYDLMQEPMKKLAEHGAVIADSIKLIAQECDVIFTMLQTGEQVAATCLGENGVFNNAGDNLLYLDCSSIDVETCRELHKHAESKHIKMLDAPVSGGVKGAQLATLTIMVGGAQENFFKAKDVLNLVGKNVIYAGSAGNGQVAKICNNMLLGISMIGVSEAFNLAEKLGLNPKNFFEIASKCSGECWSLTKYCPAPNILPDVPSSNDYKAGFTAEMMLKDLRLSQKAANRAGANTPLGASAEALYGLFVGASHGKDDFSAIIKFLNGSY